MEVIPWCVGWKLLFCSQSCYTNHGDPVLLLTVSDDSCMEFQLRYRISVGVFDLVGGSAALHATASRYLTDPSTFHWCARTSFMHLNRYAEFLFRIPREQLRHLCGLNEFYSQAHIIVITRTSLHTPRRIYCRLTLIPKRSKPAV
jgi:hypothetical protein